MIATLGEVMPSVPPGGITSSVVYLLAAALGGGLIAQLISLTLRRQQRDTLIADASERAVKNVLSLMEQYRSDLAEARGQIDRLQERIAKLEQQIATSNEDRRKLTTELAEAIEKRIKAEQRVAELERQIALLERAEPPD